jgi:CubicO group peptidase (beta-lactamase class C family)
LAGGLSPERCRRLTVAMQGYIDRGEVPGVQTLIWRHGELAHRDVLGLESFGGAPLEGDALYRLGSLTKPIVSVMALAFLEEGVFRLSDRVDRWLPELARVNVLRDPAGALDDTVPLARPMTVGDLLTHRSGLVSWTLPQGPIGQAVRGLVAGISQRPDIGPDEWLARLGKLPLMCQPGERFLMGFSIDVLGILLARLAGTTLDKLLQERLFGPLGMHDTGFWSAARLGEAYNAGWLSPKKTVVDPRDGYWSRPPKFCSGGGGLISTTEDYARFGRMLLGQGVLDGVRILSRKTVEFMTLDFLTPPQRAQKYFGSDYWASRGFGLGVFVTDNIVQRGAFGNYWFNDPREAMVAVLMITVNWPIVEPPILQEFETMVYQAIGD